MYSPIVIRFLARKYEGMKQRNRKF